MRLAGVSADIQSGNVPNRSPDCYCCTSSR